MLCESVAKVIVAVRGDLCGHTAYRMRTSDPKGLYAKARSGELVGLTGIDAPYEAPIRPELHLRSDGIGLAKQVALVMGLVAAPSAEPAE